MGTFQARSEEKTGHPVADERRGLRRHHERPAGLLRERPICGVITPRRHVSPRHSSWHLDHSQINAATEVLSGVLNQRPDQNSLEAPLSVPGAPLAFFHCTDSRRSSSTQPFVIAARTGDWLIFPQKTNRVWVADYDPIQTDPGKMCLSPSLPVNGYLKFSSYNDPHSSQTPETRIAAELKNTAQTLRPQHNEKGTSCCRQRPVRRILPGISLSQEMLPSRTRGSGQSFSLCTAEHFLTGGLLVAKAYTTS